MTEPKTLAGRYELIRRIGSGGMGTVWRARDISLERDVAVKLLHDGMASDAAFAERFRREARNAAQLVHPNVAAVYDSGEDEGVPFIVMELVDGDSLHAKIHREGALPVRETVRIGQAILAALSHAHARGLVHRDMKPGNVLITADGDVKVVDFGIAKSLGDGQAELTRTGSLMGTAAYLAPEQVEGRPATYASDIYAVGCLLYACLAGAPPFEADSPVAVAMRHLREPVPPLRARRPDVPPDVDAALMRALEKDPARRYRSAAEMAGALTSMGAANLSSDAPTLVVPSAGLRTHAATEVLSTGRPRSSRTGTAVAAVAALLLAAAAVWLAIAYLSNREPAAPLDADLPATLAPATAAPTASPTLAPAPTPSAPVLDLPGVTLTRPEETDPPEDTPDPDAETPPVFPNVFETTAPATDAPPDITPPPSSP